MDQRTSPHAGARAADHGRASEPDADGHPRQRDGRAVGRALALDDTVTFELRAASKSS